MKNLIVGVVDNLPWEKVRPWAVSLKKSGFTGNAVILGYRMDEPEMRRNCDSLGIKLVAITHDDRGNEIGKGSWATGNVAFRLRNFHVWKYLQECGEGYHFVSLTDTSDLVFQINPDRFWEDLRHEPPAVYLPGEGVLIEDEAWLAELIRTHYGEDTYRRLSKKEACNSGTMFGTQKEFKDFMFEIFKMVRDADVVGIDQPAMNVLADNFKFAKRLPVTAGWACQCGTLLDPRTSHYPLICERPVFLRGVAYCGSSPFVLLHQYPRIPEFRERVAWKYIGVPIKRRLLYRALQKAGRFLFGKRS